MAAALAVAIVLWRGAHLVHHGLPVPRAAVAALGALVLLVPLAARGAFGWSGPFAGLHRSARAGVARALRFVRRRALGLAILCVVGFLTVHALRSPVRPCGTFPSDCESYVALVESLRFPSDLQAVRHARWEADARLDGSDRWAGYGSHHFMRLVPILLVRASTSLGLTVEQGFRAVTTGALLGFALAFLLTVAKGGGGWVLGAGATLLVLGLDRSMTHGFRDVFTAPDSLAFLVGLLTIAAAASGRVRATGLLAVVGAATKQNLLVLGGLALVHLFVRRPERAARWEIAAWGAAALGVYGALGAYYGAHASVVRHVLPTADPGALVREFVRVGGWQPFLGFVPLGLLAGRRVLDVARRYWFVVLASAVALAQPFLRLGELSGQGNLRRLMVHGVWPLYLLAAIALAERTRSRIAAFGVLALGAFFFDGQWAAGRRIALVATAIVLIVAADLLRRRPVPTESHESSPNRDPGWWPRGLRGGV